jgi:hypothetical protein|tara:strand:- start:346 stop:570 length:225 start_codon:yes stop_codon:yes gene_type:complete
MKDFLTSQSFISTMVMTAIIVIGTIIVWTSKLFLSENKQERLGDWMGNFIIVLIFIAFILLGLFSTDIINPFGF